MLSRATLPALFVALLALAGCVHYEPKPLSPEDTAAAFEARRLNSPELRKFLETQLGHEFKRWPLWQPEPWNLEVFTLAAYYFHPALDTARARWESAKAAELSAGGRPNPTVSLAPSYNFSSASGISPWLATADFDLPIETANKRGLRIARARALTEAARWELHSTAWKIRADVRNACTQFWYLTSVMSEAQKRWGLQKQVRDRLEQRAQAGAISPAEAIPARLAYEKAKIEFDQAHDSFEAARPRLAAAIGVPVSAFKRLGSDIRPWTPELTDGQLQKLRAQALGSRADLRAVLADYAAAQLALQTEVAKQYPDIHLGTGYELDQGDHKWKIFSLSAELPLLNRNEGPFAEAKARREELAARFNELQAKAAGEIDTAIVAYRSVRTRLRDIETVVATAAKQEEAVTAQIKAGAAEPIEQLQARLDLSAALQLRTETTYRAAIATDQLEDALQIPLDRRAGVTAPAPDGVIESSPRASQGTP